MMRAVFRTLLCKLSFHDIPTPREATHHSGNKNLPIYYFGECKRCGTKLRMDYTEFPGGHGKYVYSILRKEDACS